MRLIAIIIATLITAKLYALCLVSDTTRTLTPVQIDGYNCFDTTQTKYIASHFTQSKVKDSLKTKIIKEQELKISDLESSNYNCEKRVSNLKDRLNNAKEISENEKIASKKKDEIHNEEKKQLKKSRFLWVVVSVVEFLLVVSLLN